MELSQEYSRLVHSTVTLYKRIYLQHALNIKLMNLTYGSGLLPYFILCIYKIHDTL